jgi:hypothetical protein
MAVPPRGAAGAPLLYDGAGVGIDLEADRDLDHLRLSPEHLFLRFDRSI